MSIKAQVIYRDFRLVDKTRTVGFTYCSLNYVRFITLVSSLVSRWAFTQLIKVKTKSVFDLAQKLPISYRRSLACITCYM